MRTVAIALAALLLTAVPAAAQPCSTLAVTGAVAAGSTLTFDVTGSLPMGIAFVLVGDTLGTTNVNLGAFGSLTLDLALPFFPLPIGLTDASGAASLSVTFPTTLPATSLPPLHAQALTAGFDFTTFSLSVCTSNVVTF